ncbi:MAG: imelysin family protein [Kofleriaceae bacterium]
MAACGGSEDEVDRGPAIESYVQVVRASYADSVAKAMTMKTAIDAYVATPSPTTLEAARMAWLAAREPYGQTEVYRFYDGPIDDPDTGPEGRVNAWPLDEAFIDYVIGNDTSGIINDTGGFPTLDASVIADQNENGGEKNIATGYHAIEFLLWGQDTDPSGPGARPHTDYVTGDGGTAANQERRGQYLTIVTNLLVEDLQSVAVQWSEGGNNYAAEMTGAESNEALRRILQGMGSLSGAELSGERMTTAIDNRDQEDEHSCFSDNTHRDLYNNALGIQNVYLGTYGSASGGGLSALIKELNPALDTKMRDQLAASIAAIEAIPVPFDQAIMNDDGRAKALAAVQALQAQTETTVEVASELGIQINLE